MGVLKNLNFIQKMAWFPCVQPDPVLIIEAAFRAAGPVIMEAATFSCLDILKMRAGISPWHAKGLRALINGVNPPEIQDKINGIWKFVVPVEKLLFFMFVVDLTLEFIALWESQMFRLGACAGFGGDCQWSGQDAHWFSTGSGDWAPVTYTTTSIENCHGQVSGGQFVVRPGQFFSCFFDLKPKSFFTGTPVGSLEMRLVKIAPFRFEYKPKQFLAPWFGNPIVGLYQLEAQNKTEHTAIYEMQARGDIVSTSDGGHASVTISDQPVMNKGIFPVNCFGQPIQGHI